MININLVPEELIKKKKYRFLHRAVQNIPLEITMGIVGGFLAFLILVNVLLQLMIFFRLGTCKAIEMSLTNVGPQKVEVDAVMSDLKVLRQKISAIESITTGRRLSWAQKLNILSDSMASGAWLVRVALTKEKFVIEGSAAAKKGDYAAIVSTLSANLRSSTPFMKGLKDLEMNFVDRRKINTTEVANFVIQSSLNGK
jgi:hypothetical protein